MAAAAAPTGTPLISLRHGEDQTTLFNTNCRVDILLHHIRTAHRYSAHANLDFVPFDGKTDPKGGAPAPLGLCDTDPATGQPLYFKTYAREVPGCTDRGRFALVAFTEDEETRSYIPLLTGGEEAEKLRGIIAALPTAKGGGPKGGKKK
eukprot:TRINITY_DN19952_c0_g1_i1.p1 TRINITY_DN19952_c0_g1~~TRINITY_DN19952_c0_g1_i1.p1  ORF type:complete len:174 (+),score=67.81 TRINITY_DN19952_c0_g1_i1:78-524(+)